MYIELNKVKKIKGKYPFFLLKEDGSEYLEINHYNREDKTYTCSYLSNINRERYLKASKSWSTPRFLLGIPVFGA